MSDPSPPQSRTRQPILTTEQQAVLEQMIAFARDPHKLTFCIHGLAGTGKTTVLAAFARTQPFAALCTPTGKAASILRRKTGLPAQTIHSCFYHLLAIEKGKDGKRELVFGPSREQDSLANRVVLLDECGMVGAGIVQDILDTGAIIIATGDPGQLKPVKQDPYFTECDAELVTIHRQALDSPIIRQAHRVRQGMDYAADGAAFQVKRGGYDEDVRNADILLTYTNPQVFALNMRARALRGLWPVNPQAGEPVMCLSNRNDVGIYNGAIYTLLEPFTPGDTALCIDVDGRPANIIAARFASMPTAADRSGGGPGERGERATVFTWGYACTVHKGAGSEWDRVVLFDQYRRPDEDERRRWQYTAITRAAETITVVP